MLNIIVWNYFGLNIMLLYTDLFRTGKSRKHDPEMFIPDPVFSLDHGGSESQGQKAVPRSRIRTTGKKCVNLDGVNKALRKSLIRF